MSRPFRCACRQGEEGMGSPRRIGIEEAELMEFVGPGRLPRPIEYRVPRRPTFWYFDRPPFERALQKIVREAEMISA